MKSNTKKVLAMFRPWYEKHRALFLSGFLHEKLAIFYRVECQRTHKNCVRIGFTNKMIIAYSYQPYWDWRGGQSDLRMHKSLYHGTKTKKSEFGAWKMPSPIPTTPPTPRVFIAYTVSTSTTLVESTNCVLSTHLFIHTCTSEKTSKKVQSQ